MDGKLCPGIQTPSLKFSPSSFRESPPFNPEIFQTLPPFSNFGLYLNPPPFRKAGGAHYETVLITKFFTILTQKSPGTL